MLFHPTVHSNFLFRCFFPFFFLPFCFFHRVRAIRSVSKVCLQKPQSQARCSFVFPCSLVIIESCTCTGSLELLSLLSFYFPALYNPLLCTISSKVPSSQSPLAISTRTNSIVRFHWIFFCCCVDKNVIVSKALTIQVNQRIKIFFYGL